MDKRWGLFYFIKCSSEILAKLINKKDSCIYYWKRAIKIKIFKRNRLTKRKLEKDINNYSMAWGWWLSSFIVIMWSRSMPSLFKLRAWFTNESCWYVWCWHSSSCDKLSYIERIVERWTKWVNFWQRWLIVKFALWFGQ